MVSVYDIEPDIVMNAADIKELDTVLQHITGDCKTGNMLMLGDTAKILSSQKQRQRHGISFSCFSCLLNLSDQTTWRNESKVAVWNANVNLAKCPRVGIKILHLYLSVITQDVGQQLCTGWGFNINKSFIQPALEHLYFGKPVADFEFWQNECHVSVVCDKKCWSMIVCSNSVWGAREWHVHPLHEVSQVLWYNSH